jgi:hypothetical protein
VHQAIVLCLDLSESMNKRSGVSRPTGHEVSEEDEFDQETAVSNLLDELVKDVSEDVILENGKTHFLDRQDPKRSSNESAYSQKLLTETASQLSPSLEVLLPRRLGE